MDSYKEEGNMLNVLIIEDSLNHAKQIANAVSQNNLSTRIYCIANLAKEGIEMIKAGKADIILLDLKLPDMSGIDILAYIEKNKIQKYENSIIIISAKLEMIKQVRDNPYIHSYISKPTNPKIILEKVNKILKEKNIQKNNQLLKKKIYMELKGLHYNFAYKGTNYLAETIIELYYRRDLYVDNLKKDIYPIVAKKYQQKVDTIYCNIKQATKNMLLVCPKEIKKEYFSCHSYEQPKLKQIIFTILNKLS